MAVMCHLSKPADIEAPNAKGEALFINLPLAIANVRLSLTLKCGCGAVGCCVHERHDPRLVALHLELRHHEGTAPCCSYSIGNLLMHKCMHACVNRKPKRLCIRPCVWYVSGVAGAESDVGPSICDSFDVLP